MGISQKILCILFVLFILIFTLINQCCIYLLNDLVHVLACRLDKFNKGNNPKDSREDGNNNNIDNDSYVVNLLSIGMILRTISNIGPVLFLIVFTPLLSSRPSLVGLSNTAVWGLKRKKIVSLIILTF